MTMPPKPDDAIEIATAKIELRDTHPLIWRDVELPTAVTLKVLHDVVQAAFGWLDLHLWEFTTGGTVYGLPMDEDWGTAPRHEAAKVWLVDVLQPGETLIDYTYDFGDCWKHDVRIRDRRPGTRGVTYPRLVGGKGNAPPEDCGGVQGFYELLEARANPEHPDQRDADEWLGDYDADAFDEASIKRELDRVAARIRFAGENRVDSRQL